MTRPLEPKGIVLGYSGLHRAPESFAAANTDVEPVGRHFQGYDSAAALFVDGSLVAANQQERFSGEKYDHRFPADAVRACLEQAGVRLSDVDRVAHNFDYRPLRHLWTTGTPGAQLWKRCLDPALQITWFGRFGLPVDAVEHVRHHDAHAAMAALSAEGAATVVVADGLGETDALSVYSWDGQRLERLRSWPFTASLGLFYALITEHLGWLPNSDEHKVMGLAAYGDPSRYRALAHDAVILREDGGVRIRLLSHDHPHQRWSHSGVRTWLRAQAPGTYGADAQPNLQADLAAAVQERLVDALDHVVRKAATRTGQRTVRLVGGVAMNCSAVGKLAQRHPDLRFSVPYAAADDGTAIGAAAATLGLGTLPLLPRLPMLGSHAGRVSTPNMRTPGLVAEGVADTDRDTTVAACIASGALVAWVQGRQEFGARALGNRSLLADPRTLASRDRVNRVVKERELFRPLGPAVLDAAASAYFELPDSDLEVMTVAVRARPRARDHLPAVVHADFTSRIQVVHRSEHPVFWGLLAAVGEATRHPVLVNTSLNKRGQPIVRTADDALEAFVELEIDVLVIGSSLWAKPAWRPMVQDMLESRGCGSVPTRGSR